MDKDNQISDEAINKSNEKLILNKWETNQEINFIEQDIKKLMQNITFENLKQ